LRPLFAITDPYLNAFRGIIPAIGGLDLSPILAFTLLQVATTAVGTLGATKEHTERFLKTQPQ